MTDEQTPATPASLPNVDAVAKMSPSQVDAELGKFGTQEAAYAKLFSGDSQARKLFDALMARKTNADVAEQIISAAADPSLPQPAAGGANVNGMSRADEVLAAQWQLESGASIEEVCEWEVGLAVVSPEDFRTIERAVRSRCIENPEFMKAYLSGNPQARAIMDRWHRIATLSRPLPPAPTTGIVR